jgi:beta-lactamase regulating signal transducer with metallopeptidase domain
MNSLIENLNQWGGQFLGFAWPMLWQSSLLIALVLALDFLLARKIRAAVRYALWLAVLVKLLLPPALALPTGAAWWLIPAPPVAKTPAMKKFTVTYENAPVQPYIAPPMVALPAPPPPRLELAGWTLLASAVVSFGLLAWLALRWWQVTRMVRGAVAAEEFSGSLDDALRLAGTPASGTARNRRRFQRAVPEAGAPTVRLKIVEGQMSPAVCGLLRPVILLPRALAENLSSAQLRAVLLHEIVHLRRRDVWVNCAQALLQIVYWWHPLLWFANARIRRVREEAVDDAVMLALRDEADAYAPTLLEVAKLAFQRPLMSLGLVGILESRSALRQRIERLINFRAPRCAGLTFASLCGIFIFSAVALPMGGAPEKIQISEIAKLNVEDAAVTNQKPASLASEDNAFTPVNSISTTARANASTNALIIKPQILVTTFFFKAPATPKPGDDERDTTGVFSIPPAEVERKEKSLEAEGYQKTGAPRAVTISGELVEMYVGNATNSISFSCRPTLTNGFLDLQISGQVVNQSGGILLTNGFTAKQPTLGDSAAMMFKMRNSRSSGLSNLTVLIRAEVVTDTARFQPRLQSISKRADGTIPLSPARQHILDTLKTDYAIRAVFHVQSFSNVVGYLTDSSRKADPSGHGINFLITDTNLLSMPITINPPLTRSCLKDFMDAMLEAAPRPVTYAIADYGVIFSTRVTNQLLIREFRVDTNIFLKNLYLTTRQSKIYSTVSGETYYTATTLATEVSRRVRNVCTNAGVNLDSPPGKAVFFNDKSGKLLVRATEKDLDLIEELIHKLNTPPPPQLHIKARFIEVPKGTLDGIKKFAGSTITNATASAFTGILTDANFRTMLHALEAQKDFENLGEPEVTTTSGRQTQVRATQVVTIITNVSFEEKLSTNSSSAMTFTSDKFETGPVFDVVPAVLSDGYTLDLKMTASCLSFVGYAMIPSNAPPVLATNSAGEVFPLPQIWPAVEQRQSSAHVYLWDGQTAMLRLNKPEQVRFGAANALREATVARHIADAKRKHNPDVPLLGGLFQNLDISQSENEILVFVTANIVDPAGNRVHADEDLPFAQKGVPAQPASR